jgi:hypothetical protein
LHKKLLKMFYMNQDILSAKNLLSKTEWSWLQNFRWPRVWTTCLQSYVWVHQFEIPRVATTLPRTDLHAWFAVKIKAFIRVVHGWLILSSCKAPKSIALIPSKCGCWWSSKQVSQTSVPDNMSTTWNHVGRNTDSRLSHIQHDTFGKNVV